MGGVHPDLSDVLGEDGVSWLRCTDMVPIMCGAARYEKVHASHERRMYQFTKIAFLLCYSRNKVTK